MIQAAEAELQVRLRRAAFNRALAQADFAVIGTLLAPDVVLVTGTDSAVINGRKAQLAAWKREFTSTTRTIYIRTPQRIIVSTVEPIAMEHGDWTGIRADSDMPSAEGTYAAKWRRHGEAWIIVAEIFVTLR